MVAKRQREFLKRERKQMEHEEWSEPETKTMTQHSFLVLYSPVLSFMFRIFVGVAIMLSMN